MKKADDTADRPGAILSEGDRLESRVHRQRTDSVRFSPGAPDRRPANAADLREEHGVLSPAVRAALAKPCDTGPNLARQGDGSRIRSGLPNDCSGEAPLSSVDGCEAQFIREDRHGT